MNAPLIPVSPVAPAAPSRRGRTEGVRRRRHLAGLHAGQEWLAPQPDIVCGIVGIEPAAGALRHRTPWSWVRTAPGRQASLASMAANRSLNDFQPASVSSREYTSPRGCVACQPASQKTRK